MIQKNSRIFRSTYLMLLVGLLLVASFSSCSFNNEREKSNEQETIVYDDISFVEFKFPKIKGIKSVKYIYINMGDSGIGLQPKEFKGMIQIDSSFAEEIYTKYAWEEKEMELPSFIENGNSCTVLYSDDFDNYIHTNSFVGEFYFNKESNCLYFFGNY